MFRLTDAERVTYWRNVAGHHEGAWRKERARRLDLEKEVERLGEGWADSNSTVLDREIKIVGLVQERDAAEELVLWFMKRCDWYNEHLVKAERMADSIRAAGAHDGDIKDILDKWEAEERA